MGIAARFSLFAFAVISFSLVSAQAGRAAHVAVYEDPAYVYPFVTFASTGDRADPTANVKRLLAIYDHTIVSISDSTPATVSAALAGADVLHIPALFGDLAGSIDPGTASAMTSFVSGGGAMVIHHGLTADTATVDFLNAVFGLGGISAGVGTANGYTATPDVVGTAFEGTPELASNGINGIGPLGTFSLPPSATPMYLGSGLSSIDKAPVVRFDYGAGRIVFIASGYHASAPFYHINKRWVDMFELLFEDALTCGDAGAADGDSDGIADICDNCPALAHSTNSDCDADGVGDPCDPDTIDADGDGRDDACDPCVNVGGARVLTKAKIRATNNTDNSQVFYESDTLDIKGSFALPAGSDFSVIDPLASRIRVQVTGPNDRFVMDTTLPGLPFGFYADLGDETLGWKVNGSGTSWIFKRKRGTSTPDLYRIYGGVRRVKIRDQSKKSPGLAKIIVKSRDWIVGTTPADVPLFARISVADPSLGECTETAFVIADCKAGAKTISCK